MKNISCFLLLTYLFFLLDSEFSFAQDYALNQLQESPRHQEWVQISDGDRTIHSFVVYPEVSDNALAVIVIHENRGLTDWVRSFTDQIASAGYIAIAPDLLSDFDENHRRTSDFENEDAARDALYQLDPDQITMDLHTVEEYVSKLPAADGRVVVAGFCWGGSQSFRYATNSSDLKAALVFYGSATTDEDKIARIQVPVYGFYGGNDQRINATIPETEALMDQYGKYFEYRIFDGAGHGYMRTGDDPSGADANVVARNHSWNWIKELLERL